MRKPRVNFSADELVTIYNKIENGTQKSSEVATYFKDVSPTTVYAAYKRLRQYIFHFNDIGKKYTNYMEARIKILRETRAIELEKRVEKSIEDSAFPNAPQPVHILPPSDTATLEAKRDTMIVAITDYIIQSVMDTMNDIAKENAVLREALEQAKPGNWSNIINKRFKGEL